MSKYDRFQQSTSSIKSRANTPPAQKSMANPTPWYRNWSVGIIAFVFSVVMIQIAPSIIYYIRPMHRELTRREILMDGHKAFDRVEQSQIEDIAWLRSYAKFLKLSLEKVESDAIQSQLIHCKFKTSDEAKTFAQLLSTAGVSRPQAVSHLRVAPTQIWESGRSVAIARSVTYQTPTAETLEKRLKSFDKRELSTDESIASNIKITPEYESLLQEAIKPLAIALTEGHDSFSGIEMFAQPIKQWSQEGLEAIASQLQLWSALTDKDHHGSKQLATTLSHRLATTYGIPSGEQSLKRIHDEIGQWLKLSKEKASSDAAIESEDAAKSREQNHLQAEAMIQRLRLRIESLQKALANKDSTAHPSERISSREFCENLLRNDHYRSQLPQHPLFAQVDFDPLAGALTLRMQPHLEKILNEHSAASSHSTATAQESTALVEVIKERLFASVSKLRNVTGFDFDIKEGAVKCKLTDKESHKHLLTLGVSELETEETSSVQDIYKRWKPQLDSFSQQRLPLLTYYDYLSTSSAARRYSFVVLAPGQGRRSELSLDRESSFFVILNGSEQIAELAKSQGDEALAKLSEDFMRLYGWLSTRGYTLASDDGFNLPDMEGALVFELRNPYHALLASTRLPWRLTSKRAYTEYGNLGELVKQLNAIDDTIHEEHLLADENFKRASVDLTPHERLRHAPYRGSLLLDNFKLTLKKIFRGDYARTLRWGMDLSGGKSVRLALHDQNAQRITAEESLRQAQNELTRRLNKLGLAEMAIRIEGDYLVVDFPSSQSLSAKELIKASTMSFHIVNEIYSPYSHDLGADVTHFLGTVWNEAQLTGRTDLDGLNAIASRLLGRGNSEAATPSAQKLKDAGLRILPLEQTRASAELSESLSMIVPMRDSHTPIPLLITFRNFALEGSNIASVYPGYDPTHGNFLSFTVSSSDSKDPSLNPQEALKEWTKRYCQETIEGTELALASAGRGWRMAVLLNGEVVSSPGLSVTLIDSAMIHGNFTQRQAQKLSADLKAGSLSFKPVILSEENISPELGLRDRQQGLIAATCALVLVVLLMTTYYGFAGVVASVAVLLNLLMIWAVLQNLGAALTLAGIAGIVLTVGMSVDANVLIFERIREELMEGRTLIQSIQLGYQRAFSAIVDSNVTTVLAALILIQFDSGPIKGFAMTLIIGIVSSMFTALFATRTFFTLWAKRDCATLSFKQWINAPKFDFFKYQTLLIIASVLFITSGLGLLYTQKGTILGMDFSGGYGLSVTTFETSPKESVTQSFLKAGMSPLDFDIREVTGTGRLKIQINGRVDSEGVFAHFTQDEHSDEYSRSRVEWIYHALQDGSVDLKENLNELQQNWTSISSQLSERMRTHALGAIMAALLGILLYIAFRFEWRYALSSVLGLAYDILCTLSAIAWMKHFDFPIQIDLQAVGALMTIIGYALNDTIIIFDRIREDGAFPSRDSINSALSRTLSRTLITSGTTLAALLALNVLGGITLLSFSMIMTIGVVVGTFCSIFITSYILHAVMKGDRR